MHNCDTPFGTVQLERYPPTRNPTLQPFDAADLYLLNALAEDPSPSGRVLVVNDQFGALGCALAGQSPQAWGDSHLAERALRQNLRKNGLPEDAVPVIDSQHVPEGSVDRVLLRIPKSLTLLEQQLVALRPHLEPGAKVVAAAMIKHLPPSAGDLLAKHIGPYQASLGWKKARLLTATLDPALGESTPDLSTRYPLPEADVALINLPGVFSRDRLDIGTRALLPHIPVDPTARHIIDLGCGNGALGIVAALRNPQAQVTFVDESYAAVASARLNARAAFGDRDADFIVSDGLIDTRPGSADLILCNPPFHQQQVVGDEIAQGLFRQSRAALAEGGRLIIVGNRHLGYHVTLKRLFKDVKQLGATSKFVVLEATKG
ncbi:16S rRNA (guanine1207-N2)-methyltransferase [Halopseudomonas xinjiangensis]|uniref:16S rRNA (Guanine1207-N2)-methyltransferase n=1 Tax=Halopseudomonas xinjiangensis TaxID=487184 RepID=A0A1H1LW84_9GAMM|nr:methyltransferase [Halopseudomonas xinjiangensis]SDR78667.1 16S rRNA (guanine1207-N2)-methyltransferase [Halopseudomonas xinjiangensis]